MDAITAFSSGGQMPRPQGVSLTDEQKSQAMEIVSRYDPETMTAESREEMRSELQEAGIGRGKDLGDIMVDQGFEVKRPSGKGPGGPPPPQGGSEEDEEIAAFAEKYESGELSSEDIAALMELLRDRGESGSGVLMDEQA